MHLVQDCSQNVRSAVQISTVHTPSRGRGKFEYSRDHVPRDPRLVEVLLRWRSQTFFAAPEDWLFVNPVRGKPHHQEEIPKTHLKRAAIAAGIGEDMGWHNVPPHLSLVARRTGAPM